MTARRSTSSDASPAPDHGSTTASNTPASGDDLAEYHRKRDFERTAEPEGRVERPRATGALRFVIQKHAASQLHFDLRLEIDGVMKSWAVPKGPSADPTVRRLAMQVEDHPISYNTFEGNIPAGEYGGGTVMLWDRGTYTPEQVGPGESDNAAAHAAYERGDFKVTFHGERMHGSWVLVRTRGFGKSKDPGKASWLLIKHRDAAAHTGAAGDLVAEYTTSVATGRTMDEIRDGAPARDGDGPASG